MTRVMIVTSFYIATQMLADIASLKIVPFFGFSMDAGTLIYPITFTLRDLVHKVSGKRGARTVILSAGGINLLMAGFFWLVSRFPFDPNTPLQPDWDSVLSPVWRIVIASILAEIVAELTDTEVYHLFVTKVTERYQWARVLSSNTVSVPLDSLIFVWAAFGGVYSNSVVGSIFVANVLLKGAVTLLSLPLIYLVPGRASSTDPG
jgi:uncharacterized integral membrane protein (TIGR00697 family)